MAIVWTVPRAIGSTLLVAPLIKEFLVEGDGTLDAKLTAVGTVSASLEKQVRPARSPRSALLRRQSFPVLPVPPACQTHCVWP